MNHVRKTQLGHLDGKGFDLAGPHRSYAIADRRQGEAANSIKQASHGKATARITITENLTYSEIAVFFPPFPTHFVTTCTIVLVVLTAAWAV